MSLQVRCPNTGCGKVSMVPDAFCGKSVRCRSCHGTFRVNDAVTARETVTASVTAAEPAPTATAGPTALIIGRFEVRARLGSGAFGVVSERLGVPIGQCDSHACDLFGQQTIDCLNACDNIDVH